MATTSQTPPPSASEQLEEFIFHPDQFHTEAIPRGLNRAEIVKFIESHINRSTEAPPLQQAEKVIDFYDLQEVCGYFTNLLNQGGADRRGLLRSIVLARTIALVCPPAGVNFAADYATYLAGQASTIPEFQELVGLNDALGARARPQPLRLRMEERLKTLEPTRQTDYQAQLEYYKVEELLNLRLARSEKANALKEEILKVRDRPERIREEIKMYLTIQYGYLEYLQPWAARRLRREVWSDQPEQQVHRAESSARRAEVSEEFRNVLGRLDQFPHVLPENKNSLRVRCLRAIDFFGGSLSSDEREFLKVHAGKQADILSNE